MLDTNFRPSIRFGLCLLVILCARSAAEDNSNLLSRLHELLSKNRQPVLLVLDHAGLKSSNRENNAYNSLEEKNVPSSLLSGLNENNALSAKRPLLQRESNRYHGLYQDDQGRNSKDKRHRDNYHNQLDRVNDLNNRYQYDRERSLLNRENDRQYRYKSYQDRNRNLKYHNRNTRLENRNRQNRYREQYRDLQDRYDDDGRIENLNQLDKHTNLLYQQNRHLQYKNGGDRSETNLDNDSRHNRQRYYDRKERKRGLRSESPVAKSLLRISNILRCDARDECQDECEEESKDSCENECEQKFECDDGEKTGSTKGVPLETTNNCNKC